MRWLPLALQGRQAHSGGGLATTCTCSLHVRPFAPLQTHAVQTVSSVSHCVLYESTPTAIMNRHWTGVLRREFGDYFGICVAGYPEAHPDGIVDDPEQMEKNYWADIAYLKQKVGEYPPAVGRK